MSFPNLFLKPMHASVHALVNDTKPAVMAKRDRKRCDEAIRRGIKLDHMCAPAKPDEAHKQRAEVKRP